MISKFIITFISILSLTQCKDVNKNEYSNQNCYEVKDNYVFLNFYNDTNEDIYLPKLTSVIDKDFYFRQGYFEVKNDTLFIQMPNESHIHISDISPDAKIVVKNAKYKLEKEKHIQQVFKVRDRFKYIVLDSSYFFDKCHPAGAFYRKKNK